MQISCSLYRVYSTPVNRSRILKVVSSNARSVFRHERSRFEEEFNPVPTLSWLTLPVSDHLLKDSIPDCIASYPRESETASNPKCGLFGLLVQDEKMLTLNFPAVFRRALYSAKEKGGAVRVPRGCQQSGQKRWVSRE